MQEVERVSENEVRSMPPAPIIPIILGVLLASLFMSDEIKRSLVKAAPTVAVVVSVVLLVLITLIALTSVGVEEND